MENKRSCENTLSQNFKTSSEEFLSLSKLLFLVVKQQWHKDWVDNKKKVLVKADLVTYLSSIQSIVQLVQSHIL